MDLAQVDLSPGANGGASALAVALLRAEAAQAAQEVQHHQQALEAALTKWEKATRAAEALLRAGADTPSKIQPLAPRRTCTPEDLQYQETVEVEEGKKASKRNPRKQQMWSPQETLWVKEGVSLYGEGNWLKIKESYDFKNRSAVSIKDRWRVVKKNGL